jgi:hypothetical protein
MLAEGCLEELAQDEGMVMDTYLALIAPFCPLAWLERYAQMHWPDAEGDEPGRQVA